MISRTWRDVFSGRTITVDRHLDEMELPPNYDEYSMEFKDDAAISDWIIARWQRQFDAAGQSVRGFGGTPKGGGKGYW